MLAYVVLGAITIVLLLALMPIFAVAFALFTYFFIDQIAWFLGVDFDALYYASPGLATALFGVVMLIIICVSGVYVERIHNWWARR